MKNPIVKNCGVPTLKQAMIVGTSCARAHRRIWMNQPHTLTRSLLDAQTIAFKKLVYGLVRPSLIEGCLSK